jgi:polyisoprenyl-phosphate glycosyltransferase
MTHIILPSQKLFGGTAETTHNNKNDLTDSSSDVNSQVIAGVHATDADAAYRFPAPSVGARQIKTDLLDLPRQANREHAPQPPVLSIVVPVFNETEVLTEFHSHLSATLDALNLTVEIIYINDGSSDQSLHAMLELQATDERVAVVNLSRNFGKEIAVTAGLDHVRGEAAIVIDADLQDPPEVIPDLVAKWREGYDVVYAKRRERQGDTWLKRQTAAMFYRTIRRLGEVPIPEDTGDFRLLNKRCLVALATCRERRRFMKGLFAWIGFRQTAILYDRAPRFAGETKWNYWRLWNFAIEGITSFTIAPLKLATYAGTLAAVGAFLYGTFIVGRTIILGRDVPGYASLMTVVLFSTGLQLVATGIIGEYVGRIYVETKGRPLYLLDNYIAPRTSSQSLPSGEYNRNSGAV